MPAIFKIQPPAHELVIAKVKILAITNNNISGSVEIVPVKSLDSLKLFFHLTGNSSTEILENYVREKHLNIA